jgi:hypothetical protein
MAQAVSRRPLTATARVRGQVIPYSIRNEKLSLGEVFVRVI